MTDTKRPASVKEYKKLLPPQTVQIFEELYELGRSEAPEAAEVISYSIPALRLNSRTFVYFSGWKDHVSIHPVPKADVLQEKIRPYVKGKGTVSFPLDKKLPAGLIKEIVRALCVEIAKQ